MKKTYIITKVVKKKHDSSRPDLRSFKSCMIKECPNSTLDNSKTFIPFPNCQDAFERWSPFIKTPNLGIYSKIFICSDHFKVEVRKCVMSMLKEIKEGALPIISGSIIDPDPWVKIDSVRSCNPAEIDEPGKSSLHDDVDMTIVKQEQDVQETAIDPPDQQPESSLLNEKDDGVKSSTEASVSQPVGFRLKVKDLRSLQESPQKVLDSTDSTSFNEEPGVEKVLKKRRRCAGKIVINQASEPVCVSKNVTRLRNVNHVKKKKRKKVLWVYKDDMDELGYDDIPTKRGKTRKRNRRKKKQVSNEVNMRKIETMASERYADNITSYMRKNIHGVVPCRTEDKIFSWLSTGRRGKRRLKKPTRPVCKPKTSVIEQLCKNENHTSSHDVILDEACNDELEGSEELINYEKSINLIPSGSVLTSTEDSDMHQVILVEKDGQWNFFDENKDEFNTFYDDTEDEHNYAIRSNVRPSETNTSLDNECSETDTDKEPEDQIGTECPVDLNSSNKGTTKLDGFDILGTEEIVEVRKGEECNYLPEITISADRMLEFDGVVTCPALKDKVAKRDGVSEPFTKSKEIDSGDESSVNDTNYSSETDDPDEQCHKECEILSSDESFSDHLIYRLNKKLSLGNAAGGSGLVNKPTFSSSEQRTKPMDFCIYCESFVSNFSQHIFQNHKYEIDVQEILSKAKESKARSRLMAVLRNRGNVFVDNIEKCVKPIKIPSNDDANENLPCNVCLKLYSKKEIWWHKKQCGLGSDGSHRADMQNSWLAHFELDVQLKETVFPRMRQDEISLVAQSDKLICAFGTRFMQFYQEKKYANAVSVTSQKMRELAKLLIQVRRQNPSVGSLLSALQPQHYVSIVEAAKHITRHDFKQTVLRPVTFALNLTTSLKQCCELAIALIKEKGVMHNPCMAEQELNLKTMMRLISSNWRYDVADCRLVGSNTIKMLQETVASAMAKHTLEQNLTSYQMCSKKVKRILVRWTNEQKKVVIAFFKHHIKNRIAPKKIECERVRELHPELNNKSWRKIKVFIQNQFNKKLNLS
ncbi:uncharacterized protein LOC106662998 isoform X4 [Cimex lectularius]|uniref:THAP-type domain-containing protein n=1 Tax=Cimex lectularius TaxID=79782 RepID=A0A8I6SKI2_CIMLE|nr:uncharacterized protein LOC106662998 isoform X4 [Cimex lectularius]